MRCEYCANLINLKHVKEDMHRYILELHEQGISTRHIADILKSKHGMQITHMTVQRKLVKLKRKKKGKKL